MKKRRPRILAVDDHPMQLELLARGLTFEGFDVATSAGPIGITNLVRTFQPDIALVDLHMPILPGDRFIELIRRAAGPDTKYFLLSACDESELRLRALETGVDGWLSKSIGMAEIGRRLKDALATTLDRERPSFSARHSIK